MRVVQGRRGAGFAQEALDGCLVGHVRAGQKLERDLAAEREVLGQVNLTHAAGAQLLQHVVVRDGLADHRDSRPARHESHLGRETDYSVRALAT